MEEIKMRIAFVIVLIISSQSILYSQNKNLKYWDDLSGAQKHAILNDLSSDISLLYKKKIKVGDNKKTTDLLDTLSSFNQKNAPLYFFLFNEICLKSDGAFGELLGRYYLKIILNDPEYVFNYLSKNEEALIRYAEGLGYEFYFKEEETSSLPLNYNDFKREFNEKMKNSTHLKEALLKFHNQIVLTMRRME